MDSSGAITSPPASIGRSEGCDVCILILVESSQMTS